MNKSKTAQRLILTVHNKNIMYCHLIGVYMFCSI